MEGTAECAAASGRLLDWYLAGADAGARMLYPEQGAAAGAGVGAGGLRDRCRGTGLARPGARRPHRGRQAGRRPAGDEAGAWLLADTLRGYFWLRMCTAEWLSVSDAGLAAAREAGTRPGKPPRELCLADLHRLQGGYEVAIEHYSRATALARQGGWHDGESALLTNLGTAYFWLGRLSAAADHWQQGLELATRTGRTAGSAATLGNLGLVYWLQGDLERAAEHHGRALATCSGNSAPARTRRSTWRTSARHTTCWVASTPPTTT